MHPAALIFASGLALTAGQAPAQQPIPAGRVTCLPAAGVDPALANAFCAALGDQAPAQDLRAHVLIAGRRALSARLDHVTAQGVRPGARLDFSVMDRDLTAADLHGFARDALRLGFSSITGSDTHV